MNTTARKELQVQYRSRETIGGVYVIKNRLKNKLYLDGSLDLWGSKNRFEFAVSTGSCVHPKLQDDWIEQNGSHFEFEVLDELKKGETQTDAGFRADIEFMKQMWCEKLAGETLY